MAFGRDCHWFSLRYLDIGPCLNLKMMCISGIVSGPVNTIGVIVSATTDPVVKAKHMP